MKQNFIIALILGLFTISGEAKIKPNILFIMVDDLGKDWISCYGADDISTPHIDRLANGGLKFHNAWSMPQCTPTRATLLTGQYPWRTGWVNHWDVPRWGVGYFDWVKYTSFAKVMKTAGYATAIAGKWQINDFRIEPDALKKHGFDDWAVWTGYETGNPPSNERYWDAYIHTRTGSKTYKGEFGPDIYCNFLIDFMKRHRDEPMMLYFPMALTHGPLVPTPDEHNTNSNKNKLKGMVRYTDTLVGRLVSALNELKIRERTIVIFTTDNGTSGGLRGTVNGKRPSGGKASKYEGGVCQPFIVNGPTLIPGGRETDALTDFSDLLPTFAELGQAQLPKGIPLDGKSFASLLLGQVDDSPRDWIMALGHGAGRLDEDGVRGTHDFADRVFRDKRYKVWVEHKPEITALYDLQNDPLELQNLIKSNKSEHIAALKKFRAIIDSQPKFDGRPLYRPRKANSWDRIVNVQPAKNKKTKPKRELRRQRKTSGN